MDKNMTLDIGFKGQLKVNAQAVPMQEGYLKIGGIIDVQEGKPALFGCVLSAEPSSASVFKTGIRSGEVVRGICVFDDAIAQNAPAHHEGYLPGFPAAALSYGCLWLSKYTKTAAGAIDPVIGAKVIFKNATGEIEFIPSTDAAPSDWTELAASVKDVDDAHGALIYMH